MEDSYRAIDAMNSSTLKHGLHSMLRMKRVIDGEWKLESDAAKIGTAIHVLVLEPEHFDERYCELPAFELSEDNKTDKGRPSKSKATSFYKSAVNEFLMQRPGIEILNAGQMGVVQKAGRIASQHPVMRQLLDEFDTQTEVTLLGEIEGVKCKARLDSVNLRLNQLLDLKTCTDASQRGFGRQFANLHYGFQLAFYRELYRQNFDREPDVNILAVETSGDYDRVNYPIPECALDVGFSQVRETMRRYKQAKQTNSWPGLDGGKDAVQLYIPQWAMEDAGDDLVGFDQELAA